MLKDITPDGYFIKETEDGKKGISRKASNGKDRDVIPCENDDVFAVTSMGRICLGAYKDGIWKIRNFNNTASGPDGIEDIRVGEDAIYVVIDRDGKHGWHKLDSRLKVERFIGVFEFQNTAGFCEGAIMDTSRMQTRILYEDGEEKILTLKTGEITSAKSLMRRSDIEKNVQKMYTIRVDYANDTIQSARDDSCCINRIKDLRSCRKAVEDIMKETGIEPEVKKTVSVYKDINEKTYYSVKKALGCTEYCGSAEEMKAVYRLAQSLSEGSILDGYEKLLKSFKAVRGTELYVMAGVIDGRAAVAVKNQFDRINISVSSSKYGSDTGVMEKECVEYSIMDGIELSRSCKVPMPVSIKNREQSASAVKEYGYKNMLKIDVHGELNSRNRNITGCVFIGFTYTAKKKAGIEGVTVTSNMVGVVKEEA